MLLRANSLFSPILTIALNQNITIENHNKNKIIDHIVNIIIKDFKEIEDSLNPTENKVHAEAIESLFDCIEAKLKITKSSLYDSLNNKFVELEEYNLLALFCLKSTNKFAEALKQIDMRTDELILFIVDRMISYNLLRNFNLNHVTGNIKTFGEIIVFIDDVIKNELILEESTNSLMLEIDLKLKVKKMEQCVYM